MTGVVKNTSQNRYFEAGHMINHDSILNKTLVTLNYLAETEVMVLKYEAGVFQTILDKFPDFYEDIKELIDEKKEFTLISERI